MGDEEVVSDHVEFVGRDAGADGGSDRFDSLSRDPSARADAFDLRWRVHIRTGERSWAGATYVFGARDGSGHGACGGDPSGDEVTGSVARHRLKTTERKDTDMAEWWYNHRTGEVEEGPQSLGSDRDGPFATREDAERAPQIAQERARAWASEDEADR